MMDNDKKWWHDKGREGGKSKKKKFLQEIINK